MVALECIYKGPICGDCTSHNTFVPMKTITVAQLCREILNDRTEWGYISVINCNFRVSYRYGNCVDGQGNVIECELPKEIADMKVQRIEWYGGWTRSDWHIYVD